MFKSFKFRRDNSKIHGVIRVDNHELNDSDSEISTIKEVIFFALSFTNGAYHEDVDRQVNLNLKKRILGAFSMPD